MFSFRCDTKQNLRDVKVHGLFTLLAGLGLHKPRSATLDLNLAASFLLNVFDVVTSATNNLCSQVEATDRVQAYGKLLFRPFALELELAKCFSHTLQVRNTYTTKFIALEAGGAGEKLADGGKPKKDTAKPDVDCCSCYRGPARTLPSH